MRSNAAQQKNRRNGQLDDMADITDVDIHGKLFLESMLVLIFWLPALFRLQKKHIQPA